jgi:hypothetical protein
MSFLFIFCIAILKTSSCEFFFSLFAQYKVRLDFMVYFSPDL